MKIAIYTAIFGDKDDLKPPLNFDSKTKIDYVLFTDNLDICVQPYKTYYRDSKFGDVAKNARYYKIIADTILKDYDLVIWHDANIQICHNQVKNLVAYSQSTFLTTFTHPHRNDFYSEAMSCIRTNKDFSLRILKQAVIYFFKGMPAHNGMYSTGILIKNYKFYETELLSFWWQQTLKYSRRDQLSLPFILYKTKSEITIINENIFDNEFSTYHAHKYSYYKEQIQIMSYNYGWLKKMSFYGVKLLRKIKKF